MVAGLGTADNHPAGPEPMEDDCESRFQWQRSEPEAIFPCNKILSCLASRVRQYKAWRRREKLGRYESIEYTSVIEVSAKKHNVLVWGIVNLFGMLLQAA